jgi:hypothetical protein
MDYQESGFLDQSDEESQLKWYVQQRTKNSRMMNIEINNLFYQSLVRCIKRVLANDIIKFLSKSS